MHLNKLLFATATLLFISIAGISQTTHLSFDSALSRFRNDYPQEKIFLQTDRSHYFPGESIWMKLWCTLDGTPTYLSRIVYVDLTDQAGNVILKKMYQLDSLSSTGADLDIPTSIKTGNYTVNAYTLWMRNFPSYLFSKPIFIYNNDYQKTSAPATNELKLTFFPEGGDLVAGLKNRVAFKAADKDGFPQNISGTITDNANNKVADFSAEHDGIGTFEFTPENNKDYRAEIRIGQGSTQTFKLPKAKPEGIVMRVENANPNRLFVLVERAEQNKQKYNKLKVIAQMHSIKVASADLNIDEGLAAVPISKKNLPPGIMQITVFDENNMPLAERIAFVENYEISSPAVSFETTGLKPRAKNAFSFTVDSPHATSLSVLVTDAALDNTINAQENIASSLLATSDLKGYIYHPGYYFKDKQPSTLHHLDLLMMTHGWRRFDWQKILNNQFPTLSFPVESSITIRGKVLKSDRATVVKDGKVSFIIKGVDSTSILADAQVTDKGEFLVSDLNFRKKAKVAYQGTNNKQAGLIVDVKLDPAFVDTLKKTMTTALVNMDTTDLANRLSYFSNYLYSKYAILDTGINKRLNYLGNVVVTARKKSKVDSLNAEYATGPFSFGTGINPEDYKVYPTIWQMMATAVPGLRVEGDPMDPTVYFSRFQNMSNVFGSQSEDSGNAEENGIAYFLNEMNVSKDLINTIQPEEIALIKVYKNEGAILGVTQGAIAIYTKKGFNPTKTIYEKSFQTIEMEGYSIARQFYSPDYSNPSTEPTETDKRFTLFFSARPKAGKDGKYHVQFYNTDITKKYKVLIQGIDNAGALIYYEKVVQ